MIVTGAVWLIQILCGAIGFNIAGLSIEYILGVIPALVVRGFVWQLGTYMFLHDPTSIFHILFNLVFIWMFGGELERAWGGPAFLRYYLVCGIGGGVFATIMGLVHAPHYNVVTFGASGALFGLIIAFGMVFSERTVLFMLLFPMKARTMAMILFAIAFFSTITRSSDGISHVGHLGGAVTGFLYLKRVWRVGDLYRELKWKIRRRRFKVMQKNEKDDFDRWIH
jgi:membrane associated rhomboid family serine protease